jgi:hypothetical protein
VSAEVCDRSVTWPGSGRDFRVLRGAAYGGVMAPIPRRPRTPDDAPEEYVGLTAEDAERRARERGWSTVRRLPPDAVITMEYMPGRLNLAVSDGAVVRCWQG